jgi:hypothetical protein
VRVVGEGLDSVASVLLVEAGAGSTSSPGTIVSKTAMSLQVGGLVLLSPPTLAPCVLRLL